MLSSKQTFPWLSSDIKTLSEAATLVMIALWMLTFSLQLLRRNKEEKKEKQKSKGKEGEAELIE